MRWNRRWLRLCLVVLLHACCGQLLSADEPALTLDQAMQRDAALVDAEFVDGTHGWVVGHRGTIWHTSDGGRNWRLQETNTTAPLAGVSFINRARGWAVGGTTTPYTHRTRGIVLRTLDGGATWQQLPTPTLPRLIYVKFFDDAHGVAVGEATAMYPSGVFRTTDGGQSWNPAGSGEPVHWQAAAFASLDSGVLVDEHGRSAQLIDNRVEFSRLATPGGPPVQAMKLDDPLNGWRVGGAALVQSTNDGGTSWRPAPGSPLPNDLAQHFDATAVATHGNHVWIAGSPGSQILHSADSGANWTALPTGVTTPLRDLHFVDERRGWAVGDLGTILSTTDGGRTWQVERRGGDHAAVWLAASSQAGLPLELIAHTAAGDGMLLAADRPLPLATVGESRSAAARRLDEALITSGATSAGNGWRLHVSAIDCQCATADELLEQLNTQSDGRALQWLVARAARELRVWRPEVVVVPHPGDTPGTAVDQLIERVVLQAIDEAARDDSPLATHFGLPAHTVKRVVGRLPDGGQAAIVIPTGEFVSALGTTPEEFTASLRGLVHTEYQTPAPMDAAEIISQQAGLAVPRRDLMTGIFLAPGGGGRRVACQGPLENLQELRLRSQKRRHLVRLLDYSEATPGWSGQVVNLTGGLGPEAGGQLMFQLAEGYRETGRLDLAADTYYLMGRRYPDHPLIDKSLQWLVSYYASGEIAHAAATKTAQRVNTQPLANVTRGVENRSVELPSSEGQTASLSAEQRFERAKLLGDYLRQARPDLSAVPELGTSVAVAQRQRGFSKDTERHFLLLGKSSVAADWRRVALAERWLAEPQPLPPTKPIATCRSITARPHLDGELTDDAWSKARPVELPSGAGPLTRVWLACDTEFLYIAGECPIDGEYAPVDTSERRQRDADTRQYDRIRIELDTDRDYSTTYQLTVDYRGWTHDSCWGDDSWNPTWYVACSAQPSHWRFEAAIPWTGLVDEPPNLRAAWTASITRDHPGRGATAWPSYAPASPDRLGLLLFE